MEGFSIEIIDFGKSSNKIRIACWKRKQRGISALWRTLYGSGMQVMERHGD